MDGRAYITHVGDSRAYLIRAGRPMQITKDHTLGEWLDREGFGNRSENRFQNVLVNAIGGGTERAIIDMTGFDLLPDDALVLCSDGLTRSVADKEIAEIVSDSASASEACDRLLAVALERDGGDNVTVVIACSAD
jgi:protein phosphatase